MRLQRAQLRETVREELGEGGVQVELEDAHIDRAIAGACNTYNRYLPPYRHGSVEVTGSTKKYEIDHPGIVEILDVQFLRKDRLRDLDLENPFVLGQMVESFETSASVYHQGLGYMEDARAVYSSEPTWTSQWEQVAPDSDGIPGQVLYLYVDIPTSNLWECSYMYAIHVTPDDATDTGLHLIPVGHIQWFEEYTTARAKIILGRIRDKFKGIPLPDGGSGELDGMDLISEGKEEVRELIEDIRSMARQMPPITG